MRQLCAVLQHRFVGVRTELRTGSVLATLEIDGVEYRARMSMEPAAQVAVALPSTDGFDLTLQWSDRWANDGRPRAASFDDSFLIQTNDLALAAMWLDHVARSGLLASRYVAATQPSRQ